MHELGTPHSPFHGFSLMLLQRHDVGDGEPVRKAFPIRGWGWGYGDYSPSTSDGDLSSSTGMGMGA